MTLRTNERFFISERFVASLGLCKLKNEILKNAKNAEKSHFQTKTCHF